MKTKISGGTIIAFQDGEHKILENGELVFEDDRIVFIGKNYGSDVDSIIDARGQIVSPGLINMHALASTSVTHLALDGPSYSLEVGEKYAREGEGNLDLDEEGIRTSSKFAIAELIKGGSTTIVGITPMANSRWQSPPEESRALAETMGELGARGYISHQYRSAVKYKDDKRKTRYNWNEDEGERGLMRALEFCDEYHKAFDDRLRTMLFPYQFENCSLDLLRKTKQAATENDWLVHMHAAEFLSQFHESLRQYGKTPVQCLHDLGFLGEDIILTHVLYTTFNKLTGYPKNDDSDIRLLAESGTNLVRCPAWYARGVLSGAVIHSFNKYADLGVNMCLGTDTFPMDMFREMRHGSILGKAADRNRRKPGAKDVFNAATVNGAKALDRKDLGRICSGAKADIITIDANKLELALNDDPVKTLVYMANQTDVDTVIIDGDIIVDKGELIGLDEKKLAREANALNQEQKDAFVRNHPREKSENELFPPTFDNFVNE